MSTHFAKRGKSLFGAFGAMAFLVAVHQNCSPVGFEGSQLLSSNQKQAANVPQYSELKAGSEESFPPLKLIFVVDNSGTMGINQINLSDAFAKMFEGSNASNLAPFDTTAFIINTSQKSVDKNDAIFNRLPQQSVADFASMATPPRANILDGKIPGDLVGYQASVGIGTDGLERLSFLPASVAGFQPSGGKFQASLGLHKDRNGSVASFAQDFRDRVDVLKPSRSAIDPATHAGVLDPIIDNESGLCALARVMKHNSDFVSEGDQAAFIFVSDEDDNDPSGSSCIDAFVQYKGSEDLIDGRCEMPRTELTYNSVPSAAQCRLNYDTGFKYSYVYNKPQTSVSYSTLGYTYDLKQTNVSFYRGSHTYDQARTKVSYYTKSPTFEIPQTSVHYFKEVKTCDTRDGAEINCQLSYPAFDVVLDGSFGGNCASFVSGKLPSGALYTMAGKSPSCSAAANLKKNGDCSTSDNTKLNCQQNYSAKIDTYLPGNTSDCDAFVAGKLGNGAVYSDAGFKPSCATANVVAQSAGGLCPTNDPMVLNCQNAYPSASMTLSGATTDCASFVSGKLGTDALYTDSAHKPVCSDGPLKTGQTGSGTCPTDSNKVNCVQVATKAANPKVLDGELASGQTCAQFASGKLGANAIYDSATDGPTCSAAGSVPVTISGDILFKDYTAWATPTANSSCKDEVSAAIKAQYNVPSPTSCTVTAMISTSQTKTDTCAANTVLASTCSNSNGASRNCVTKDIPAGSPVAIVENQNGSFNCDSLCSDTLFCKDKPGTVRSNYPACSTKPLASTVRPFDHQLMSNTSVCSAPEVKMVTNGPYREVAGRRAEYVAGIESEKANPMALANYIHSRSQALFKSNLPSVSVFVRQSGDSLGTNGSFGTSYNSFANLMAGEKRSVLSDANGYASSLQSLSAKIREKLNRSFNVKTVSKDQQIRTVWHRKAGATDWGTPVDASAYTVSGGTVTFSPSYQFEYGDEFRFEYY